jgi:hypothetical protein
LIKERKNLINVPNNDFIKHQTNYNSVPFMLCLGSISGRIELHFDGGSAWKHTEHFLIYNNVGEVAEDVRRSKVYTHDTVKT